MLAVFLSVGMQEEKGKEEDEEDEDEDTDDEFQQHQRDGFIILDEEQEQEQEQEGNKEEIEKIEEIIIEGEGVEGGEGGGKEAAFNVEDYEQFIYNDPDADDSLAKFLEENDDFVVCPAEGCGWIFEKVENDSLPSGITVCNIYACESQIKLRELIQDIFSLLPLLPFSFCFIFLLLGRGGETSHETCLGSLFKLSFSLSKS